MTLELLPNFNVFNAYCHGFANFQQPLNSGLLMANDETLSLRDLLDLKLKGLCLAVLSACETGIPGTELPDEVISLPTGLLQAGTAGVVSSLWSVADLSTMLLLSRFYQLWRRASNHPRPCAKPKAGCAIAPALIWLPTCNNPTPTSPTNSPKLPIKRPFAHPFHWAAFTYTGV